jgi:F-actin-capping protein subunit alpha
VSPFNRVGDGVYVDYERGTSFEFDHLSGKASGWEDHPIDENISSAMYCPWFLADGCASISKHLGAYVVEHYPSLPAYAIYPPQPNDPDQQSYTILIVGNKYNKSSFWSPLPFVRTNHRNGRWRSRYTYNPTTHILTGTVAITVHYFEDGNVLLTTEHPVHKTDLGSPTALVKAIAEDEKAYQEELNRTFAGLGDGMFKTLRRLLPVTKQKIEWEKVASYKVKPGQK